MIRYKKEKYRRDYSKTPNVLGDLNIFPIYSHYSNKMFIRHSVTIKNRLNNPEEIYLDHCFNVGKKDREMILKIMKRLRAKFRYHCEWFDFKKEIMRTVFLQMPKQWEEVCG